MDKHIQATVDMLHHFRGQGIALPLNHIYRNDLIERSNIDHAINPQFLKSVYFEFLPELKKQSNEII